MEENTDKHEKAQGLKNHLSLFENSKEQTKTISILLEKLLSPASKYVSLWKRTECFASVTIVWDTGKQI